VFRPGGSTDAGNMTTVVCKFPRSLDDKRYNDVRRHQAEIDGNSFGTFDIDSRP
jgi:hypothetical protein